PVGPSPVPSSGGVTAPPPTAPISFSAPAAPSAPMVASPVVAPAAASQPAPEPATMAAPIPVGEPVTLKNGTTPDPEINAALMAVLANRGSDLHVTANAQPTLRIDGSLTPVPG